MKKSCYFTTIFLFLFLVCALAYCIIRKEGETVREFFGFETSEFDILSHAQKMDLLYDISFRNSVQSRCEWDKATFTWAFPKKLEYPIYEAAYTYTDLIDSVENENKETYSNPKNAVEAFFEMYPELKKELTYDYIPAIFDDVTISVEKMPVFSREQSVKILTSQLGIWRNGEGKYVAGLYEAQNSFRTFFINKESPYMTLSLVDQDTLLNALDHTGIKFLNHEFLCEHKDLAHISVQDLEVIYVLRDQYVVPAYKITGFFEVQNEKITWTAIANAIDYASLDYTIYEDLQLEEEYIPKPYITKILFKNDTYTVSGFLPHRKKSISSGEISTTDELAISFIAEDDTGLYYAKDQISALEKQIGDSLTVEKNGAFSFSFSSQNFWNVEEKQYEDDKGNELDEPMHTEDTLIKRPSYDNWFRIRVCAEFTDGTFCTRQSDRYILQAE